MSVSRFPSVWCFVSFDHANRSVGFGHQKATPEPSGRHKSSGLQHPGLAAVVQLEVRPPLQSRLTYPSGPESRMRHQNSHIVHQLLGSVPTPKKQIKAKSEVPCCLHDVFDHVVTMWSSLFQQRVLTSWHLKVRDQTPKGAGPTRFHLTRLDASQGAEKTKDHVWSRKLHESRAWKTHFKTAVSWPKWRTHRRWHSCLGFIQLTWQEGKGTHFPRLCLGWSIRGTLTFQTSWRWTGGEQLHADHGGVLEQEWANRTNAVHILTSFYITGSPRPCRISPSEGHQIHEYILSTFVHQSFKGNPRIASGPEPEYHHDSDMNLSGPHTTAKNAVQFRPFLCIYDTFMIYDHVFSQFSPQCHSCQGRSEHGQFYSKASVASWLQLSMSVIRSDSFRMQSIWSIGTRSFDMERSRFCIQRSALVGYCFRHELFWNGFRQVYARTIP